MTDLTVDPKFKIALTGKRIIVSNELAILIICVECGNTVNVYLHHTPNDATFEAQEALETGTTQYPTFNFCQCNARNPGGELHVVR